MSEPQSKIILTVVEGPEKGKPFEFTEQDNFLLGRDASGSKAHFRLSPDDILVSRNHFFIEINPPDCFLRDAGSLNGTFVIRRSGGKIIFFLQGRKKVEWVKEAKELSDSYRCESYEEVEEGVELEDGDLIKVGKTLIEVKKVLKPPRLPEEGLPQETFRCIRCGKDISHGLIPKEPEKLTSADFLCKACAVKYHQRPGLIKPIPCWGCRKDLSSLANSDGRAEELKDIALYWCTTCSQSKKEEVPISKVGDYQILKALGGGGFGVVYLARSEATGRVVALKLTRKKVKEDEHLLKMFKREISIMKDFIHPHIVRLYDEGISQWKNYYFVSEYLSEGSLADLFHDKYEGKMPYKEACYLISQAMEGLSFFHRMGYVHRDFKPENVLLKKGQQGKFIAKVGDFGLSKNYILHGGTITKSGESMGTLYYCPPEQIFDYKNANPRTDVYAVGISIYLLVTGQFPYDFPKQEEIVDMISKGQRPRDPVSVILGDDEPIAVEGRDGTLPKGLAKAINKAIQKDASERFESVDAFKKAIEEYSV